MTHTNQEEAVFLRHSSCPSCGSSDANGLYSDGHTYCFGCGRHSQGDTPTPSPRKTNVNNLPFVEVRPLAARKLTEETCKVFGYGVINHRGRPVQAAPYHDRDGALVALHLRTPDKEFPWLGEPGDAVPFGFHSFPKSGRKVVLTEGEVDAMSVSQAQGNKWPVWSIGSGAGPQTKKYIAKHLDLFKNFEEVVICFDNDEPGRKAAQDAAQVLGSRALIAELPLKDASDMLKADRTADLINCLWKALPYRPEGIVEMNSLKESFFRGVEAGIPWPWQSLTDATYGRRLGELYVIGAGTGIGKTDFFLEVVKQTAFELDLPVGLFFLEQEPSETSLRLGGKLIGKTLHIPKSGWDETDLVGAWDALTAKKKIFLYNAFGSHDYDSIEDRIRYLAHGEGVKHFFVDHLTALSAQEADERKALDSVMARLGGLVKELNCCIYLISHLATPEGKPHEEGGRVFLRHFRGSRAIGMWAHFAIGLERDTQAADLDTRHTTTVRILKDRYTGRGNGVTFGLRQDALSGLTGEVDLGDNDDSPFPTNDDF